MADKTDETSTPTPAPSIHAPQSQHERWFKYGLNVVISSIIVILLAWALIWLAQSRSQRIDTTTGGTQSLRPQSVNFIRDLKQKVTIVALYPRLKTESKEQDFYQPVADLLNEYTVKGSNITTQLLDPDTQKDEFNKLVNTVTNRYGGEVKGYKAILDDFPAQNKQLIQFTTDEADKLRALSFDKVQDQQLQQEFSAAYLTLVLAHHQLNQLKTSIETELAQQIPSYKDSVDELKTTDSSVSSFITQFAQVMDQFKISPALPKEVRDYAAAAELRAADAKRIADVMVDKIQHLGALKELVEFKTQLQSKSILVMTDSGYKILPFSQVWKVPEASRFVGGNADVAPKLSFAGEQRITAAIAALTGPPKPMVVFVRPGGAPLTTPGPGGQPTAFSALADRLRDDNFEIGEKDASGQSAMQQQEMPVEEPTPEQMKSAIWVVCRFPHDADQGPSPLDSMLADHLKTGGSAMVFLFPTTDAMDASLLPWGIKAKTDYVIVHELLPTPERRTSDLVESAMQSSPMVVKVNEYGNHPIANPLAGLDLLQFASVPIVSLTNVPGVAATPLLPIPQSPHSWAASNPERLMSADRVRPVFNPKPDPDNGRMTGDLDNTPSDPLYGAAASEKAGGARLVAIGSYMFATSDLVDLPDQTMLEQHGYTVSRLPGNGEFFVNSILWLAHMDAMLAISPHALQVARVRDLSPGSLAFWRLGVLTAGLPLAVVALGFMVYLQRRD